MHYVISHCICIKFIIITEKCPRLQEPSNGKILYQLETSYIGSEVIYQCGDQSKEVSRKCLPGGVWESLAAECKSKLIIIHCLLDLA